MIGDTAHRLTAATAELDRPLAALDVSAMQRNVTDLLRRAGGTPIRVASKSVRCRWVLENVLAQQGFSGIMGYSLPEAIWLVRAGFSDILIGYPTANRTALRELIADPDLLSKITLMVDDAAQLDLIRSLGTPAAPVRACIDVDASLRIGRADLGVRRSPIRTPEQAAALARAVVAGGKLEVVGVMFYEAQIAGLPDSSPGRRVNRDRPGAVLPWRR
jgi:D-serine deaminase-like pyridoxal phosphate-dependent protein